MFAPTKYLDPTVLARLDRLELMVRAVVEGFLAGRHRSPFCGTAVEFAQRRAYVPGDDIRHIDWKVQARTDRMVIKQHQQETNLPACFLVDVSESMGYGGAGGGLSKHRLAGCIAASLSLLLLRQRDAVSLATFDERLRFELEPSTRADQIHAVVRVLEKPPGRGKTLLEGVCGHMARRLGRRGLVCLISDLLGDLDGLVHGLRLLRHCGQEVIVLHVLAQDELTFPFQRYTRFVGMEQAGSATVAPRALRGEYLAAVRAFCDDARRRCIACRADYRLISTADNLAAALTAFLAARTAAVRKASGKR